MLGCKKDIDRAARKIMDFGPKILLITTESTALHIIAMGTRALSRL